eukprot:1722502-Ditylum_brightwellii.AAC.1
MAWQHTFQPSTYLLPFLALQHYSSRREASQSYYQLATCSGCSIHTITSHSAFAKQLISPLHSIVVLQLISLPLPESGCKTTFLNK